MLKHSKTKEDENFRFRARRHRARTQSTKKAKKIMLHRFSRGLFARKKNAKIIYRVFFKFR